MEFNDAAAREALEAAMNGSTEQAPNPEPVVPSEGQSATEAHEAPDTFTHIDPNTLSPELQAIYKEMQGDYTRKTQSVAEKAREIEAFGSPDQVRNAVEFVQALRDPNNLVQLHSELSEYLQNNGLTKAEADVAATSAIKETEEETEWDFTDPDETVRRELEELKRTNQDLVRWREEFENQRQAEQIERTIARMETKIREDNPHYNDSDIDDIYSLSYAFGGDLFAAQDAFEHQRQRILKSYMDSKSSVPSGLAPVPPGSGQAPESFGTDLDAAHTFAKARLLAETEGQGF